MNRSRISTTLILAITTSLAIPSSIAATKPNAAGRTSTAVINTILNGKGVPSNTLGINGDFYIDTRSLLISGPKANGKWPTGRSLQGANGVNGIDGNPDGTNGEDFLKVWIIGENESGTAKDSVDFYLADYRFSDNNLDYIVDTWENIDLTTLNVPVNKLSFRFESSDVNPAGPWINTPTYFAIDEISYKSVLGLNSVENDFVNIWPNPATDRISVTGMEGSLTLTALNGQNVFSTIHKDITSIDMSTFQKGIYFLKEENGNVKKVIKN